MRVNRENAWSVSDNVIRMFFHALYHRGLCSRATIIFGKPLRLSHKEMIMKRNKNEKKKQLLGCFTENI